MYFILYIFIPPHIWLSGLDQYLTDSKWIRYDQVTNYLDMVIFFLKKLLWGPRRPKIRDFGYHGPWPTIFWGPYVFGPPDPPYMARNAKMCYFEHFFGVRWKKPPLCRGPPWKILHWKFVPAFFYGLLYMLGLCLFIFATFSNEKVFTVTVNVTVTGVRWTFWNLTKKWK